jgi:hypothetical protein
MMDDVVEVLVGAEVLLAAVAVALGVGQRPCVTGVSGYRNRPLPIVNVILRRRDWGKTV